VGMIAVMLKYLGVVTMNTHISSERLGEPCD